MCVLAAETQLGMPASHFSAPGFKSQLQFSFHLPTYEHLGGDGRRLAELNLRDNAGDSDLVPGSSFSLTQSWLLQAFRE